MERGEREEKKRRRERKRQERRRESRHDRDGGLGKERSNGKGGEERTGDREGGRHLFSPGPCPPLPSCPAYCAGHARKQTLLTPQLTLHNLYFRDAGEVSSVGRNHGGLSLFLFSYPISFFHRPNIFGHIFIVWTRFEKKASQLSQTARDSKLSRSSASLSPV